MKYSELIDILFDDMDEKRSDADAMRKIKNYINRGYLELAKREKIQKSVVKTVVNNRIVLPDDCTRLIRVYSENDSIPFRFFGKNIELDTEGQVRILYQYLPDKLIDLTDETETNESNIEFIINYAKWLYYLSDGLEEESKTFKVEYEGMRLTQPIAEIEKVVDVYKWGE